MNDAFKPRDGVEKFCSYRCSFIIEPIESILWIGDAALILANCSVVCHIYILTQFIFMSC